LENKQTNKHHISLTAQQQCNITSSSSVKQKKMSMTMENGDEFAVGCFLSIRTTLGDEFEGQVMTFDRETNYLVLQESSKHGPRRNVRLLKADYIKDFTFLGQGQDPLLSHDCSLDLNALQSREELAIRYSIFNFSF
jgi:hypothetical protein